MKGNGRNTRKMIKEDNERVTEGKMAKKIKKGKDNERKNKECDKRR